jgi:predicted nucleic acid-binding protein
VTSQSITFDAGVLIALERRRHRAWLVYRRARERGVEITVPAPVLGEWWRGRTDLRDLIRTSVRIEPLTDPVARLAGEALAAVRRATTIDAFVMASAALRGDVVYTGDFHDLDRLRAFFPGVRVLAI